MADSGFVAGTFPQKMALPMTTKDSKKWFGLLSRRERWSLSLRGWVFGLACVAVTGLFLMFLLMFHLQPFLAHTQRVDAKILVVEGWAREFAMNAAVTEFQTGHRLLAGHYFG